MDLSIFATPEAWISLITLLFLEIILGVDNIVFISLTSDRLEPSKRHIGRKLGLAGALIMRILFLSLASFLVHISTPLFTIDLSFWSHAISVRDLILLAGGAYLIYKGIAELRSMLALNEIKHAHAAEKGSAHFISLPQAVGTIMVMDVVFSIDSVITAVGLADHLIIMILAVVIAILLMMVFIDPISNFINKNAEMKILALTFIAMIGLLLVLDSLGIHTGITLLDMPLEKLMVYFAMLFSVVMEVIQIRYRNNLDAYLSEKRTHEGTTCADENAAEEKSGAKKNSK